MSAHGAGKAYAIGLMMGLMSKGLTYDEAKWITLHPAGKGPKASGEGNKKGVPALIDGTTGKILGGLGGKFTGKTIKQVKASSKKAKAAAAAKAKETKKAKAEAAKSAKVMSSKATEAAGALKSAVDQLGAQGPEYYKRMDTLFNEQLTPEAIQELKKDPASQEKARELVNHYQKLVDEAEKWEDYDSLEENKPYMMASEKLLNHLEGKPVDTSKGTDPLTDPNISMASVNTLHSYTGAALYELINNALYENKASSLAERDQKALKQIEQTFKEAAPLEKDIKVYRGAQFSPEQLNKVLKTKRIESPAFVSTSTDESTANDFSVRNKGAGIRNVLMNITVPKGAKAINMQNVSLAPEEYEVLLNKGSKFKVSSVGTKKFRGIPQYVLNVELE